MLQERCRLKEIKGARVEWLLLKLKATVIPAQAGIQMYQWWSLSWIPACAGMTIKAFEQDYLA